MLSMRYRSSFDNSAVVTGILFGTFVDGQEMRPVDSIDFTRRAP